MLRKYLDNRAAAVLAVASLGCLVPGLILPCIEFSALDGVRSYSLPESIWALLREGQYLVGGTLFAFSLCFPVLKLAAVLAASSRLLPLSPDSRRRIRKIVAVTGKYSMLDVFVLAVLVVAVKLEGMIQAKLLPGTVFFLVSIVLSMLAAQGVRGQGRAGNGAPEAADAAADLPSPTQAEYTVPSTMPTSPQNPYGRGPDPSLPATLQTGSPAVPLGPDAPPIAWRGRKTPRMAMGVSLVLLFLAGCLAATLGARMLLLPADIMVDTLELTKGKEFLPSMGDLLDTPDYYLRVVLTDGTRIDTECEADKLIGNGITWTIDPVPLADIREISVMDENDLVPDTALDRVTVRQEVIQGQRFTITLTGPPPESRVGGIWLLALGGVTALALLLRFLVRQAF